MSDVVQRAERNEAFTEMKKKDPSNKVCVDCDRANPQWASVNNSCFFCIVCSGVHRSVGVDISYVRSCTMDSWRKKEIVALQVGGNGALKSFWKEQGFPADASIEDRYSCKAMAAYRDKIKALKEGRPAPNIPRIGFQKPQKAAPKRAEHVQMPNDRSGRGIAGGNNIADIKKNSYGGMGSSNYGGMGSGGSSQNNKGDDPWGAISDGFFNVANYTASATKKAASVVADRSAKAAAAMKERNSNFDSNNFGKNVSSSATQGWSSLSSWVGAAASTVASATGQAVQVATEYVAPTGGLTDGLGAGQGGRQGGSSGPYEGLAGGRASAGSGSARGSAGSARAQGSGQSFCGFDSNGSAPSNKDNKGGKKKDDEWGGNSQKKDDDWGWDNSVENSAPLKRNSMSRSKSETDTSRASNRGSGLTKPTITKSKTESSELSVKSLSKELPKDLPAPAKQDKKEKDDFLDMDDDWWNDDKPAKPVTMTNRGKR